MRVELQAYLREHSGHAINLIIKEDDQPLVKKIVYTNQEQFDEMAEKNPALLDLAKRFKFRG
jgi:hypothetical protein